MKLLVSVDKDGYLNSYCSGALGLKIGSEACIKCEFNNGSDRRYVECNYPRKENAISFKGSKYKQFETYEQAESLLGKTLIGAKENNNLKSKMLVTQVKMFENGNIKVNKLELGYLFRFYTMSDGSPVGVEAEEEFKLPELSATWKDIAHGLCISYNEAKIRRYIKTNNMYNFDIFDGKKNHPSIYFCSIRKIWDTSSFCDFNGCIFVNTFENAEWLCEKLNKLGVKLWLNILQVVIL